MAGRRDESRLYDEKPVPTVPYSLDIVLADPQTLQIIVHHAATMDRAQVKNVLQTAKDAIRNTARKLHAGQVGQNSRDGRQLCGEKMRTRRRS